MKKIYKSILGIALSLGLTNSITGQVSNYSFSQNTGNYVALTGGTVVAAAISNTTGGAPSIDDIVYNLPNGTIPFSFMYNGTAYTGLNINANGYITLGAITTASNAYSPINSAVACDGIISVWGRDINSMYAVGTASVTGDIKVGTVGSTPNREFVIQYANFRPNYTTSTSNVYAQSFQIRLQETSNKITFSYAGGAFVAGTGTTSISGNAQIGLRGATNSDFNIRTNSTTAFNASTMGTSNTNTQAYDVSINPPGMPTNGLMYVWTPAPTCSGAPTAGMAVSSSTFFCTPNVVNLSLTGNVLATGLTYQWLMSTNGGSSWSPVASATMASASNVSVTTSTMYKCLVSCNTSTALSTGVTVTIGGATVVSPAPYFEGFESITANDMLPNCSWMVSDPLKCLTYTATPTSPTYNRIPKTGNKFASFKWGTPTTGSYFFTNAIQLGVAQYTASVDYISDGLSGWSHFEILYGTSQSTTGLVSIASISTAITNTVYANLMGTFTPPSNNTYYIAIKAIGNTTPWYLTFDDLKINGASTIGINELNNNNQATVYPNPNAGELNITLLSKFEGTSTIKLFDAVGKIVITEKLNAETTKINTSYLDAGVYFYTIENGTTSIKTGKLIKQ